MLHLDSDKVYRASEFDRLNWVEHGFGTRLSVDWPNHASLASAKQIHSDTVLIAERAGTLGEGDALISAVPGLALSIRTADCLPILIADQRNTAVAAVHAGWRGVVREILARTVEAMGREFGARPKDLVVVIGPGIGPCCFEVGPEVACQFMSIFPDRQEDLAGRAKLDLRKALLRQMGQIGIPEGQIGLSEECTKCCSELFHSYRREREAAGRMSSLIGIR